MTVGDAIDILLSRVRDPNAAAFGSPADTRLAIFGLLNHALIIVSVGAEVVVEERPLTTVAGQPFYDTPDQLLHVRVDTHELKECAWEELARGDRGWLRREGGQPRVFARLGIDMFTLSPLPTTEPAQILVNVVPAMLVDEAQEIALPEEAFTAVLAFTESLIHLRRRIYDLHADALARGVDSLKSLGVEIATPPTELPGAAV